jgi:hypothetical protein
VCASVDSGIGKRLGLEKIKTIGDAYMVVAGVPEPRADHVQAATEMALAMHTEVSFAPSCHAPHEGIGEAHTPNGDAPNFLD